MVLTHEQKELHDRMVEAKELYQADILKIDAVRAISVELRKGSDGSYSVPTIVIYVDDPGDASIPDLPKDLGGFPVTLERDSFVKQSADASAQAADLEADTKRYNPLLGGISIAPSRSERGVGTLGLIVRGTKDDEDELLLSNYHVMCLEDGEAKVGDEMCQEARVDNALGWCGNCASLLRWKAGNVDVGGKPYGVDAAVARKTHRSALVSQVVTIGKLDGIEDPALGMVIEKRGRTTELTRGKITSVSLSVKDDFGPPYGNVILENQLVVAADDGVFSAGGDSGSVYVNASTKKVVGLHWGSRASDRSGLGNDINAVVAALDILIPSAV